MHDDLFQHHRDMREGSNDSRFRPTRNISSYCKKGERVCSTLFHNYAIP